VPTENLPVQQVAPIQTVPIQQVVPIQTTSPENSTGVWNTLRKSLRNAFGWVSSGSNTATSSATQNNRRTPWIVSNKNQRRESSHFVFIYLVLLIHESIRRSDR
jgi:hypothetical protein